MMLSSDMHIPLTTNFPTKFDRANILNGDSDNATVALSRRIPPLSLTTPVNMLSSQMQVSQSIFSFPVSQRLLQSVKKKLVQIGILQFDSIKRKEK